MRVVFAGTPAPALPTLQRLLASRHQVVGVVSRPDAPAGRGRRPLPSPVADLAQRHGLPLAAPLSARSPDFAEQLTDWRPDVGVVVAYGQILRPHILQIPTHGWTNLHFSLLPAWRGAAPVAAAIRAGDDMTGASAFRLAAGMDTGPVYGVITEPIRENDTAGTLLDRLSTAGADLVLAVLDALESGTARAVPQPDEGVSLAPKIAVSDAEIDWQATAAEIDRLVRAMTPEPGAWTGSPWGRLLLGPVRRIALDDPAAGGLAPGEISFERRRVRVGTATEAVVLTEVQAAGKRRMAATDWARGVRPGSGSRFGRQGAATADAGTDMVEAER